MDPEEKDVTIDGREKIMYGIRLSFENGKILSPSDVHEQVREHVKKHGKIARDTVGRIGDLLMSSHMPGMSFAFTMGWYFRKGIESLEKKNGECKIQYESEEISKDVFVQFFSKIVDKEGDKMKEYAKELLREGLPDDMFDDEE